MSDDTMPLHELRDRLRDCSVTMVTTLDADQRLSSRPMTVQEIDDGGDLIFLVDRRADWVVGGHDVNVSLVDPGRTWVSVVGTTELNGDRYSVDPYWDDDTQQRFQGSRDHVCALVVRAQRWDYWTAPNRVAEMIELAKAFAIDRAPSVGGRGAIET